MGNTVAQRDWRFWLKVLIGAAFGLLIADVLLFTLLDAPLLKSQQVRASTPGLSDRLTQTAATQALILPTYDPLKPRPSPTPRPTATPWLIARVTATPAPTASGPPGTSTLIPANAAEFGVTPEASGAAAPATPSPTVEAARPTGAPGPTLTSPRAVGLVVTPTPTLTSPVAIEGTGTPTPTLTPPEAVEGTGTPTPGATPVPTETPVVPDDTPGPTPLPDTPEPSPTVAPGDFAQFTAYVQDHYNSIAGQPLEIGAVTSFAAGDDAPVVTVEVIGDGTNSVFAQTPAAALDYGRRLLNDTKSYFDGQPCAVSVVGKYDATDPGPCNNNPSWCTVGERNPSDNSWSIAWTYIRGKFIEGSDTVETWNEGS